MSWQRTLGDAVYWLPQPTSSWGSGHRSVCQPSQAWLTRLATLPPLVPKADWPRAGALAGRALGSQSGQPGVNLLPRDHQFSEFLPPGFGSQPAGTSPIGGYKATSLQTALGAAPLAPGKQKVRGPRGSYLAPLGGWGHEGYTSSPLPQLCRFFETLSQAEIPRGQRRETVNSFYSMGPPYTPPPNFLPPLPAPPCVNRKWRGKGSEQSSWEQEAGSGRQAWCQPCPSWLLAGGPDPLWPGKEPADLPASGGEAGETA